MKKENLELIENKPTEFRDKKYGFHFIHDLKENLDREYPAIYDRYAKRAKRFIESIQHPTCFFRAVRSEKEIGYIINNADYVENVLKRYDPDNAIVYILLDDMSPLPKELKWFRSTLAQYSGNTYEMRNMFYRSESLIQFCETLSSPEQILANRKFDQQQNGQKAGIAEIEYHISNDIDGIDKKIAIMLDLQEQGPFYIWGRVNGIPLYHYLVKRNMNVRAIIDNRPGNVFPDDVCIIPPNDIEPYSKIFIAVTKERSNLEIKEQVKDKKCHFLTYKELEYGIDQIVPAHDPVLLYPDRR